MRSLINLTMRYILFGLMFFVLSCNDEIEDQIILLDSCVNKYRLAGQYPEVHQTFANVGCDPVILGPKKLSEQIKLDFVDFCNRNSVMFLNSLGQELEGVIKNKSYKKSIFEIRDSISQRCITHCLRNEEALVEIVTDKFAIEIILNTRLNYRVVHTNSVEESMSGYSIYAKLLNKKQSVFDISIENFLDEPIFPDTSIITYHESIILNGESFNEIFSNENQSLLDVERKEKVYFHTQKGLVAVRDSLGELWTIN